MVNRVIQFLINALALGGLYALTTLGLSIVFGIAQLLNFAYGELIMAAGYTLWFLTNAGVPWLIAAALSIVVTIILAVLMERVGFRPLRGVDPNTLLISSFAIGSLLQNVALVYVWPRPVPVSVPSVFSQNFMIGDLRIPKTDVLSIVVTLGVLALLTLFLKRTIIGIALRAAAEDFTTTRLMGIRANAVIATAFVVEGFLAGIVMILWVGDSAVVYPTLGLVPVLIAFMAGTVGGIQSLSGSVLGGFLVGFLFTALATLLPTELQPFRQAILFGIAILILLVRPQGLIRGNYQEESR